MRARRRPQPDVSPTVGRAADWQQGDPIGEAANLSLERRADPPISCGQQMFDATGDRLSQKSDSSARTNALHAPFINLRILQKHIERRRHRRIKAAPAFEETAANYIEVEEAPQRMGEHLDRRKG